MDTMNHHRWFMNHECEVICNVVESYATSNAFDVLNYYRSHFYTLPGVNRLGEGGVRFSFFGEFVWPRNKLWKRLFQRRQAVQRCRNKSQLHLWFVVDQLEIAEIQHQRPVQKCLHGSRLGSAHPVPGLLPSRDWTGSCAQCRPCTLWVGLLYSWRIVCLYMLTSWRILLKNTWNIFWKIVVVWLVEQNWRLVTGASVYFNLNLVYTILLHNYIVYFAWSFVYFFFVCMASC